MNSLWRIPDFLDLEYFFIQDKQLAEEQGEAVLRDRDRTLYLDKIASDSGNGEPNREWLIFRWLQERRTRENKVHGGQALLPGRMWYELYGLFWSVFSFLALAVGGGAAYSFLSYSGDQPVNVSLFFLVFVGFQLLLLLTFLLLWASRRMRGLDLRSSLLLSLVNKGLNRFLFRVRKYGMESVEGVRRAQFAAALAAVRTRGKGYGALFFWPLFLLFQLFGIAFNFGVLGAVLVKVASSDLAFGWQSTLQLSSRFVYRLVEWLAVPWSWLLGPQSYPSLSQVEGSRMVLKDGFYHLASEDLVSWWPFLCLAICCYCLLPRIILFVAGTFWRKQTLAAVSFARADHNQLLHRLLTPRLETRFQKVTPESPQGESFVGGRDDLTQEVVVTREKAAVHGELLALIPDELFPHCDPEELQRLCYHAFGYSIGKSVAMSEEYSDTSVIVEQLTAGTGSPCPPLLILQEAWQPPIHEVLRFFQDLRKNCDDETHIIIALVGRPTPETLFTPVSPIDLQIWQQKTATLTDPCLQVSPLVNVL